MSNASKKRTITEEVDFTGCDPDIAEALRNGKTIKCFCWDMGECGTREVIIAYVPGSEYPYRTADDYYRHAKPVFIETITVVKSEVEIMKGLMEHGYKIDWESGTWRSKNLESFVPSMWKRCGLDSGAYSFEPWMLEEWEVPESTL